MKTNTNLLPQSNLHNNLLRARHRAGLERKQVALLLSKKSTDEISRYERGQYPPNLKTALKFEIIYQTPLRLLFYDLFRQMESEIEESRRAHNQLFPNNNWFLKPTDQLKREEFCFYAELLKNQIPNALELGIITKHIIALSNAVSDYKQGRTPFMNDSLNENKDDL